MTTRLARIAILGSGGMGTAMAALFARSAKSVTLWSRDAARAAAIEATRSNDRHLPGVVLPSNVRATADAHEAADGADLVVVAIPTSFLRETLARLAPAVAAAVPALSVVKGIEFGTFARPSRIVAEALGPRPVAVLSGPSHAEELGRGLPASVVVAGGDDALNVAIRDALNRGHFRVYTNGDAVGVELAGALKNILGLAAGICDGLRFGDNAKAALLTRGLAEMARFAAELGGSPETFRGLAGVGDVITTCYSHHGRNRAVGERIGRGARVEEVLAGMVDVAEGVPTTRSVHDQASRRGVAMPITALLHAVLFEGKPALGAVTELMERSPKDEWQP